MRVADESETPDIGQRPFQSDFLVDPHRSIAFRLKATLVFATFLLFFLVADMQTPMRNKER